MHAPGIPGESTEETSIYFNILGAALLDRVAIFNLPIKYVIPNNGKRRSTNFESGPTCISVKNVDIQIRANRTGYDDPKSVGGHSSKL